MPIRSLCVCILLITVLGQLPLSGADRLIYHQIQIDEKGRIVPWFASDPAITYDHCLRLVWGWWKGLGTCQNGMKYSMVHMTWPKGPGLGGDQVPMALSSFGLLYRYTGDKAILEEMTSMADYYIAHSLSESSAVWPNLPYPYNTEIHSNPLIYDGDMIAGRGVVQPDKAGSLGIELVVLYKMTVNLRYLEVAKNIADTLADRIVRGNDVQSPWPFRVNAATGEIISSYTSNWVGTLRLFDELIVMDHGKVAAYRYARDILSAWLKDYPIRTNKWGPFFEDIPGWSDTETNADTLAWYILEHPDWDATWQKDARSVLDWTLNTLGNKGWRQYGVTPINEQTAYAVPGNSHTARHYATELLYCLKTGDYSRKETAIAGLNWATYMVDYDGKNYYPDNAVWLTDGYGDYVRHYLRAMAAEPALSPANQNHILASSSVIGTVQYGGDSLSYETWEPAATELLRIAFKPARITAGGKPLSLLSSAADLETREGYVFNDARDPAGVLRIRHDQAAAITVFGIGLTQSPVALNQCLETETGKSAPLALSVLDEGSPGLENLKFQIKGFPQRGNLGGIPPNLEYVPGSGFTGKDSMSFTATNQAGDLESNTGYIQIVVNPVNLARIENAFPFTTENPENGIGENYRLSGIADNDITTNVAAAFNMPRIREVGIGVTWPREQRIIKFVHHSGSSSNDNNGWYERGFRLQISADGTMWSDATGYILSPFIEPSGRTDCDMIYTFQFPRNVRCRGVRVVGDVGSFGGEDSWYPRVKEIRVYPMEDRFLAKRETLLITRANDGLYCEDKISEDLVRIGSPAAAIGAGDLDGDGIDDAIGSWPAQGGVWVRFSTSGRWELLASPAVSLAAGDLDGDGRIDLIGSWLGQGVYSLNRATGEWILLASPAKAVAAGDLDGDGTDDLIGIWPEYGGVWVRYSHDGSWAIVASTADCIATGDLNADGKSELVGSWAGQGTFYLDGANGEWIRLADPASALAVGDLDGDGTGDLAGIFESKTGVWARFSSTGTWIMLASTADSIAVGKLQ